MFSRELEGKVARRGLMILKRTLQPLNHFKLEKLIELDIPGQRDIQFDWVR